MRQFVTSVSPKGQITLPVEVRRLLGVHPKDKVAVTIEDGEVRISRLGAGLEASYQAVPALERPLTDEEVTAIAWEEHARGVAKQGL